MRWPGEPVLGVSREERLLVSECGQGCGPIYILIFWAILTKLLLRVVVDIFYVC